MNYNTNIFYCNYCVTYWARLKSGLIQQESKSAVIFLENTVDLVFLYGVPHVTIVVILVST